MSETVQYFGYGANRHPRMIAAITGKLVSELVGKPGILEGFSLAIQSIDQVPDAVLDGAPAPISPQTLLRESWDDSFRSYVITPSIDGHVSGTIWELTTDDRERVRDWELIDFGWYKDTKGVAVTTDGQHIPIITEQLGDNQAVIQDVDGSDYETWLNPVEQFEAVAAKARHEFDERTNTSN